LTASVLAAALFLLVVAPAMALFLGEWGGAGSADGQFNGPTAVATNSANQVYVVDSGNNRVEVFGEGGEFLAKWGSLGSGPGQFSAPVGIAIDGDGFVYVADRDNGRVQKFNGSGEFVGQWRGAPGSELGAPTGIAVDLSGNIFVSDPARNRIVKFDPAGEPLTEWGAGGAGAGQFNSPGGLATDEAGELYVADTGNFRVQKFGGSGEFLTAWGSPGNGPGLFGLPVAVSTDPVGKVYVVDSVNDQVQKFSPTGEFLSVWGEPGSKPNHFEAPADVAISFSAKTYVVDAGNNRIEVYGKIPDPLFAKTVNIIPAGGKVRFKPPHGQTFRPIYSATQIKVGSTVDTRKGRVQLTSAKNRVGLTQSAEFKSGLFKVLQPRRGRAITILKLTGALGCGKATKKRGATASRRRRSRRLWGSGKGNYSSRGSHGSATVRGTIWLTKDTCAGTLFRVKRGVIKVRDFTRHRTVKVGTGRSYFVPAH
jgi:DNA-binding beta-propeller fold protein YncE